MTDQTAPGAVKVLREAAQYARLILSAVSAHGPAIAIGEQNFKCVIEAKSKLEAALASLSPTTTDAVRGEVEAKSISVAEEWSVYMDEAVSKAPEPLRKLGEYLADLLDEDQWKTAERYLNAAVLATLHPSPEDPSGGQDVEKVAKILQKLIAAIKQIDASYIGESMHVGLRKGSDASDAHVLWKAISASQTSAWNDAAVFTVGCIDFHYGKDIKEAEAVLAALRAPVERKGEGWQDISTAPYDTPVEVQAGRMTFVARLLANHSVDESERQCDQWVAEHEDEHPPCWTDGACWESNSNEEMSIQPTRWRPAP